MQKFDRELIRRTVEGALASFSEAHPDRAIPPDAWSSVSKRAAGILFREFRLRFGDPEDRLLAAARRRRERRIAEGA